MSQPVTIETIDALPSADTCYEIAEFLAEFVQNGELESPLPGDERALTWRERLGWWWHSNPFAKPGLPLAWLMRDSEANCIVGFHGFIPHDYEIDGEVVPSLITTTFFVEPGYRTHSMKIVLKLNKLGRDFQLIDGTPSPEMRAILDKFHFEKRTELRRYNILVKRSGLGLKSSLLKLASLGKSISLAPLANGQIVIQDPALIQRIPPREKDGTIHRSVTKESLIWMSASGHGERHFFGLIDEDSGELAAFAIGLLKSQRGVTGCRILEYGSFDEAGTALNNLISRIANYPAQCGLPENVDLLLWSDFDNSLRAEPGFEPEIRESTLYFKLPASLKEREKHCLPSEGDLILL